MITVAGAETRALVEQTTVVDPQRLGKLAGRLSASEIRALDEALALNLGLQFPGAARRTMIELQDGDQAG